MSCCDFDAQSAKRFLEKIDSCYKKNDMREAKECIEFWENEARNKGDERLLLTILNEAMGVYRRMQKKNKALSAMEESLNLIEKLNLQNNLSGATIYINSATTLSFCGKEKEGLSLYDKAANCYELSNKNETYEYATLLNNKASTLYELKKYDEAEKNWISAIDILTKINDIDEHKKKYNGEIAISLVMLAHLYFDRTNNPDGATYKKIEEHLNEAEKYLTDENQVKDANYAYALKKCASSFDYFDRKDFAINLRKEANKIYFE